ncbi:MAG: selenocysteine-specific translation elongation factor [Chloroflexi bacterium]|nr:selenocysteine-specific translation elongation factor [Chloroflexota bacterium]
MFVIGTAGHVDHGKSTLVKALTGIDPDRLKEEKEREMTIDLGFAWLTLPSGREVSIVDVPGHERFVSNMLAGVGGIDLALLVVAADEAVMPQTREHLAILDLLQVKRSVVVITKVDLVDADWLELVAAEVEDALRGTVLEGSPMCRVSALTGQDLPKLVTTLDSVLASTEPRPDLGRPRLPVDRSFPIAGFGTVVTGTLIDGTLSVGQEVELVLARKRARIRGLQTHRKSEQVALPGTRTAVNLAGVSHEEVHRGDVLTLPGWLQPTTALDVHVRVLRDVPRPLKHNTGASLHTGASETLARVRLLDADELASGGSGWAQLRLAGPVAAVRGDFFVLRASDTTLGGGTVVDTHVKRHRRLHPPTLERLAILSRGSSDEVALQALETRGVLDLAALAQQANLSVADARSQAERLLEQGKVIALDGESLQETTLLMASSAWRALAEKAQTLLLAYHRQHPLRRGAPKEEMRSRLGLSAHVAALAVERLVQAGMLVEEGAWLRLPDHRVQLTQEQRLRLEGYLRLLESEPFAPPTAEPLEPDLLSVLVDEGKVVKVSDTVVFAASAYQQMVEQVLRHLREHGTITVAQARDLLNTSRKYVLSFLEHLDQRHVTRRVGDERVLR